MDFLLGMVVTVIVLGAIFFGWNLRVKYDGQIVVIKDDDGKRIISLELDVDPAEIEDMKDIRLEVKRRFAE